MAAVSPSGTLPSRTRVADAFTDDAVTNHEFLEIFVATPPAEAHAAILRCRTVFRSTLAKSNALAQSMNASDAAAAFSSNLEHYMQEYDLSQRRLQELEVTASQQEMDLRQEIATLSEQLEQCREQASQLQSQYSELQRRVESSQSHTLDDTAVKGGGGSVACTRASR